MSDFIIRRIPLAPMYRNRLVLGLACRSCGRKFTADYHGGSFSGVDGRCPFCETRQSLSRRDVHNRLDRSFRAAIKRIEPRDSWFWTAALSFTIARAAILLEPILLVVVLRINFPRVGDLLNAVGGYLSHLDGAGRTHALIFSMPHKNPPNECVVRKLGEILIFTASAASAYHRLLKKPGAAKRIWAKCRNFYAEHFVTGIHQRNRLRDKWFRPFAFSHALDLVEAESRAYLRQYEGMSDTKRFWRFSAAEEAQAREWLAERGLGKDREYVCFLGRDGLYNRVTFGFDDQYNAYRVMDIDDFLPAMDWLADKGAVSFRMGTEVAKRVSTSRKEIVEFASLGQNPFMDLYLSANCLFYVSCGAGAAMMRTVTGKWILQCNVWTAFFPTFFYFSPNVVYAPKRVWSHDARRFLTLREIFEIEKRNSFDNQSQYYENHITLVENAPEEIREYVEEMYARAKGEWTESSEEAALQGKYRGLVHEFHPASPKTGAKLCYAYLRKNPHLLADA